MTNSIILPRREDNSTTDAEKVVAWVRGFPGTDAHIVMDYLVLRKPNTAGAQGVPGPLRGVTVQWDHNDDGIPDKAIHLPVGATLHRVANGFEVEEADQ